MRYVLDRDLPYRTAAERAAAPEADRLCRLDFYRPVGVRDFPTVVYLHGGGLHTGERSIPELLKNRGWAIVGADYRLHPQTRHPLYIEDAAAAVAWTFRRVGECGGDPCRVFLVGFSAGGYLAALIALDRSYLRTQGFDPDRLAGVALVSAQMITHQTVRKEQGIDRMRPTIDRFAPLYHLRPDAPPMLCVTGGWEKDLLMRAEENRYFVSMMKLAGHRDCRHVLIETAENHGQACQGSWPHVIEFIEGRLRPLSSVAPQG